MDNRTRRVIVLNFFIISLLVISSSTEERCSSSQTIINKLRETSNSYSLPPSDNGTKVTVSMFIKRISFSNSNANVFELSGYITEAWFDTRMAYDFMNPCIANFTVNEKALPAAWQPRLSFTDAFEASFYNKIMILYTNGSVMRDYGFRIKVPCRFDLSRFPKDNQECSITYSSSEYNSHEVHLKWKDTLSENLHMSDYTVNSIKTSEREVYFLESNITELVVSLTFGRLSGWYLLHYYCPTLLLVLVSWITFCLGRAITARACLGFGCLATLMLTYHLTSTDLPKVSYLTSLDVWMLVCILFVFVSLLELALFAVLQRKYSTEYKVNEYQHFDPETIKLFLPETRKTVHRKHHVPKIVDIVFILLYPIAVIGFVFLYRSYMWM